MVLAVGDVPGAHPASRGRPGPRRRAASRDGRHRAHAVGDDPVGRPVEEHPRRVAAVEEGLESGRDPARERHEATDLGGITRVAAVPRVPGVDPDLDRGHRSGRGASDPDPGRIDPVGGGIGAEPAHRRLGVVLRRHRGGDAVGADVAAAARRGREQPVVDRRRDVAQLGEGAGEVDDVAGALVTAAEAASVDPEDHRPLRLGVTGRLVEVELQRNGVAARVRGAPVLDVTGHVDVVEHLIAVAKLALPGGPGKAATGEDGERGEQRDERQQP